MKHFWRILGIIIFIIVMWASWCCVSHKFFVPINNTSATLPHSVDSITVLTYNTHRLGMFAKFEHNRILHYIRRTDADIVCLQEVEVYKDTHYLTLPELRDALRQYPYTYYDFSVYNTKRQYGIAVFSKYPLINKQTIRYASRANISDRCDVVIGTDTLRLINNHLESNRFTAHDFSFSDDTDQMHAAQSISEKLSSARKIRINQAKIVRSEINNSPYPVLVVGDFNSIPLSYTYHLLGWGLKDCFLETSNGKLGFTYVRHHLGIRIDYILCSRCLKPLSTRIDQVDYSDHYPMVATIAF